MFELWRYTNYNEHLEMSREAVLAAVTKNGNHLVLASNELKNDREIVLAAVTQNDESHTQCALKYASDQLKNDHEIVLASVTNNGCMLEFASDQLKNDHEIVLAAVSQTGYALQYASIKLKNDREIIMGAITQNGCALKYASDQLKNDREVALAAVRDSRYALEYASVELRNDHEVALAAVLENLSALEYVSDRLKSNLNFLSEIISASSEEVLPLLFEKSEDRLSIPRSGSSFHQNVYTCLSSFIHFHNIFLFGWTIPREKQNKENKLSILNKLGKYRSIAVKKLIAEYAEIVWDYKIRRKMLASANSIEDRCKRCPMKRAYYFS